MSPLRSLCLLPLLAAAISSVYAVDGDEVVPRINQSLSDPAVPRPPVVVVPAWAADHVYSVGDRVEVNGIKYTCLVAHTAKKFADDLAAKNWNLTGREAFRYDKAKPRWEVFLDSETVLNLEKNRKDNKVIPLETTRNNAGPKESPADVLRNQAEQVRKDMQSMISQGDFDSAVKRGDEFKDQYDAAVLKDPTLKNITEIKESYEFIAELREQAEQTRLYRKARAQFDAKNIKVHGILWSADQSSLVIVDGEQSAKTLRDVVQGCEIVHIDRNRVDFLMTYLGHRYEFQRYIGEDN